jgi:ubiquinone/menaquinone biosynthesis C-methylase UbiE
MQRDKEHKLMSDVYASIASADVAVQQRLAEVLEVRAADPQARKMLEAYLSMIDFPQNARVLEVGCGTGAVTRVLGGWPGVAEVTGVDPSPVFLARARELAASMRHVHFIEGDGRSLPFDDASFDVVVFHTVLCHLPEPSDALEEALRVLRPEGWLADFEVDYPTITVATGKQDPLQACIEAVKDALVHDVWLLRRLPQLVREVGFADLHMSSYGYVAMPDPTYMFTLVERGADILVAQRRINEETATALKREAQGRVETATFFGFIGYASLLARRPVA